MFLDLELLPNELDLPEVGVVILLREMPPVLEEFWVSVFGGFPGDGGTMDCYREGKRGKE